jgi:hypothetical protein
MESKSISNGAQYVTPNSTIYCDKMCRFSSGNWFFCTKFVQHAEAGKKLLVVPHVYAVPVSVLLVRLQKRKQLNCII